MEKQTEWEIHMPNEILRDAIESYLVVLTIVFTRVTVNRVVFTVFDVPSMTSRMRVFEIA